ncbi:hypothetical protein BZA70DRAFT_17933 [Myxozyma melibiosi]|uniref:UBX domain-containing protein n=1 Tax=Myxozyma melibiosi TaxID=54550 RepID=A0ABR1FCE7_9ASCO
MSTSSSIQERQVFETSVEAAVSRSVQEHLPLVVFIADESEESNRWAHDLLGDDEVDDILLRYAVSLRLENGSTQAGYFAQIFPITHVPSLYVINNGSMVDYAYGDITTSTLIERLKRSVVPGDSPAPPAAAAPATMPTSTATPTQQLPSSAQYSTSTPISTPATASTPAASSPSVTQPRQQPRQQPAASATMPATTPLPSATSEKRKQSAMTTPSDSSSQSSNERYREELRRKRLQESEERQRILKLLQDDREERKARSQGLSSRLSSELPARGSDKKVTKDIHHHNDSALAIRLFDGSSIKQRFPLEATLGDVRVWIDSNRTDGDVPYSIISQFPHKIFSASDEQETLVALGLHPTATLILKPVSNYSSAFIPTTALGRVQQGVSSGLGWVFGAVGTFLGYGYQPPETEPEETFRVPNLAAHDPANDQRSRSTSPSGPQTIHDFSDGENSDRGTYNGNHLSLEDDR